MADSAVSKQSGPERAASKKRRQATVSTETEKKLARAARSAQRLAQLSDVSRDDSTLDLFPDDPTRATLEAMNIDIRQGTLHGFELPDVVLAAVGALDTAADTASLDARTGRRSPRAARTDEPAAVHAQLSGLEIEPLPAEAAAAAHEPSAGGIADAGHAATAPLTPAMAAATVARSITALRQAADRSAAEAAEATGSRNGARPVQPVQPVPVKGRGEAAAGGMSRTDRMPASAAGLPGESVTLDTERRLPREVAASATTDAKVRPAAASAVITATDTEASGTAASAGVGSEAPASAASAERVIGVPGSAASAGVGTGAPGPAASAGKVIGVPGSATSTGVDTEAPGSAASAERVIGAPGPAASAARGTGVPGPAASGARGTESPGPAASTGRGREAPGLAAPAGVRTKAHEARRPEAASPTAPELDRARATAFADTVDALYGVIADQRRAATDHSRRMKWMLSIVVGALLMTVAIGITQTVLLMRLTRETTAQQHRVEQMMQNQQAAMSSLLDTQMAMANAAAQAAAQAAAPGAALAPASPASQQAAAAPASSSGKRAVHAQRIHKSKTATTR
ncbi:hypothetical protein [Burkholderia sp. WSM2232]|uniref:hypothetical protein n=1 Tax=Burkholderia sp. WSM2232 TaxID=944436 RepID=UPI000488D6D7|nr:hypothetical protein [Burkholderia sp. WSM2232]